MRAFFFERICPSGVAPFPKGTFMCASVKATPTVPLPATDTSGKRPSKNPLRAIRRKCLDCSGGSTLEVKECVMNQCALWPFRFGRNPYLAQAQEEPEEALESLEERSAQQPAASEAACDLPKASHLAEQNEDAAAPLPAEAQNPQRTSNTNLQQNASAPCHKQATESTPNSSPQPLAPQDSLSKPHPVKKKKPAREIPEQAMSLLDFC